MKPGSWWEKPLWSWRQTWLESRMFRPAMGVCQGISRTVASSHLQCWFTMESTTWMKDS